MTTVYDDLGDEAVDEFPVRKIRFTINGKKKVAEIEPRLLLAALIRRGVGLTGTHRGCDTTNCGACTVLVDGRAIKSCTMLAVQADGREVTTVEGLASASELHPLQEGFRQEHGLQCGFCTPGMMLAAKALLDRNPSPTEEDVRWALSGNLCRCTGYQNIVKSVLWAAEKLKAAGESGPPTAAESRALDEIKIGGLGSSRKRVEDDRFIRGKGNYTDDIVLPGMLHMEILRSPLPHARIKSIDTSRAYAIPGVHLVLTGDMMATRNLAWMPTLSYDTQAVLATDKVRFQGQEVACVIADDPYIAKDACELIEVDYEPLPPIVNPWQGLAEDAPIIRDDKTGQDSNVIYLWEVGDKAGTERAFAQADVVSKLELHYPRSHPSPIECCGSVADFNRATQRLTVYMTTQAPHLIRAAVAMVAELPEQMIRIVSPDIGGGFGNKVPIYPGYVCSIRASILLERPVKWIEDKTGNLISTGFARDVYLDGEMALRQDGKILGVRVRTDADHGAFFSDAQPSKFKIGLMHSTFAAYDIPAAHLMARGSYTNKAPGGVAYRCSFRVTEAMFFQERMMQAAADDLGMDQAEFRRMNFVRDEDFPHRTPFGFLLDSGQYAKCLDVGLKAIDYEEFRREQAEARKATRPGHLHHDRAAGRGQQPRVRHPRHQDVRLGRPQGAHDRQGHPPDRREEPGPGARDDLGSDRGPRARHPGRGHRGRGGRHRHRAVRHGHLRLPQHAGRRGRGRDGIPQDPGQGPQAGGTPARGVRRGRRVGARPVLHPQRPGPRRYHPGVRDGGVQ